MLNHAFRFAVKVTANIDVAASHVVHLTERGVDMCVEPVGNLLQHTLNLAVDHVTVDTPTELGHVQRLGPCCASELAAITVILLRHPVGDSRVGVKCVECRNNVAH